MRVPRLPAGSIRSALVVCVLALAATASAQTCPTAGTVIFPGLDGQTLRDSLAARYRPTTPLSYDAARDAMYARIDNASGTVTCRYSGYTASIPFGAPNARALANQQNLNAEHTWPQSRGASAAPAVSDLHHLFPTHEGVNSARNNHPFAEIPDAETDTWYRMGTSTTAPLPAFLDEYSERDGQNPDPHYPARFEPREDHKGDVARAMFYFYTVYQSAADAADARFFPAQRDVLRTWHAQDTATPVEHTRTCAVATFQGNVNPFVIDPTLVERAFFDGETLSTLQFAAASASALEAAGMVEVSVTILGPHADLASSVEVAVVGGTATPGMDYVAFAPQTLTVPAGSGGARTFTLTLLDDAEVEPSETIVFELRDPSEGARLGAPAAFILTIRDDDAAPAFAWINEFHYDNAGDDTGEFVEVVLPDYVDPSAMAVVLYNGNGGAPYATYEGAAFTAGAVTGGRAFYHVATPGIQNGSPDGIALVVEGDVVQFLSYEGTFAAVGGPADGMTSTDVGVSQTGTTPVGTSISLQGTGTEFNAFTWATGVTATPGALNVGQFIPGTVDTPEPPRAGVGLAVAPNPVAGRASVELAVPEAQRVTVTLYDLLGRQVRVLHDGAAGAGGLRLTLDASGLPGGTYVLVAEGETFALRRTVALVR